MNSSFVTKKINNLLESNLDDDKETLEALKAFSDIFEENTISNRRNLRSNFEKRSLKINEEFLSSFNEVNKVIDSLHDTVSQMNLTCIEVKKRILNTKEKNQSLVKIFEDLKQKLDATNNKQYVLNCFLNKFQLLPEEILLINSNKLDFTVNERFFNVFEKVQTIHNNAKIILIHSNHQTTAIEIMDNMSQNLEILFNKLYKWTLGSIRTFNSSSSSESSKYIHKSLEFLLERLALFKLCLEEYSTIRRSIVSQHFLDALTKEYSNTKYIGNFANDSVRYLTNMLSWIHEVTISEKQILEQLLINCSKNKLDEENIIQNYLSFIMDCVNQPARIRIEQILIKETNCIISYNLRNLLYYYKKKMSQLLVKSSTTIHMFNDLFSLSHRIFINCLNYYSTFELTKSSAYDFEQISPTLNSTPVISQANSLLKDLVQNQNSTFLDDGEKQEITLTIISIVFEPYLNAIETTSLKLHNLEKSIFTINCLNNLFKLLQQNDFLNDFCKQINQKIDENIIYVINEQISNCLAISELTTIYNTILKQLDLEKSDRKPLSTYDGCYALALQSYSKKIDYLISSRDNFFLPKVMLINKLDTKYKIQKACIQKFSEIYKLIFDNINDSFNEYDESFKILPLKPEQVEEKLNTLIKQ